MYYFVLFLFGLVFGSFLTSFTYRIVKGEILPKGRSYCPKCKKQIAWYDNIPLFSYIVLGGKCRHCKKHISFQYPLIELTTAVLFTAVGFFVANCQTGTPVCTWNILTSLWALPYLLAVTVILLAVFIIDIREQIIPDELSFSLVVLSFIAILLSSSDTFWVHLLSGFGASLFLLFLHLITLGRGMGLGDVKLALGIGFILGWPYTFSWILLSFVLGALIGLALIIFKLARFGKHIAFGPFLVVSFFIVLFWGSMVTKLFMPYL